MLTTIDVKATLAAKLGAEVDDYTIHGACNPRLATPHSTRAPRSAAALHITVRRVEGSTIVQAVDPGSLLAMAAD